MELKAQHCSSQQMEEETAVNRPFSVVTFKDSHIDDEESEDKQQFNLLNLTSGGSKIDCGVASPFT